MAKKGRILVIDDNKDILEALTMLLASRFELVTCLESPKRLLSVLNAEKYDVIILDMNFASGAHSGNEGLFWLSEILKVDPGICVIMITAYGDVNLAVKALKLGATDFVLKPWDNARLVLTIEDALKLKYLRGEVVKSELIPPDNPSEKRNEKRLIGSSPNFLKVLDLVKKVAATDANVLITGENGTGKELIAREIHLLSLRGGQGMISVDLGSISPNLFESELFGHVKGSFTDAHKDRKGKFEAAHKSTLFLDEIGNLSIQAQVKLLAALQNREITPVGSNQPVPIDIRLICATNADLDQMITDGDFREDLLYRINTIEIKLPALRDRTEDIPELAAHFAEVFASRYMKKKQTFTDEALQKLISYEWPGNIRELQHMMEKAVILATKEVLDTDDFELRGKLPAVPANAQTLEDMEKAMILKVVSKFSGNMSSSAEELGVSRQTLYNKIKKYELEDQLPRHE